MSVHLQSALYRLYGANIDQFRDRNRSAHTQRAACPKRLGRWLRKGYVAKSLDGRVRG